MTLAGNLLSFIQAAQQQAAQTIIAAVSQERQKTAMSALCSRSKSFLEMELLQIIFLDVLGSVHHRHFATHKQTMLSMEESLLSAIIYKQGFYPGMSLKEKSALVTKAFQEARRNVKLLGGDLEKIANFYNVNLVILTMKRGRLQRGQEFICDKDTIYLIQHKDHFSLLNYHSDKPVTDKYGMPVEISYLD